MLGTADVDAQGHHAAVLAEVGPIDHQRHQMPARQITGEQPGQGSLDHSDEPSRNRRLRVSRIVSTALGECGFGTDATGGALQVVGRP